MSQEPPAIELKAALEEAKTLVAAVWCNLRVTLLLSHAAVSGLCHTQECASAGLAHTGPRLFGLLQNWLTRHSSDWSLQPSTHVSGWWQGNTRITVTQLQCTGMAVKVRSPRTMCLHAYASYATQAESSLQGYTSVRKHDMPQPPLLLGPVFRALEMPRLHANAQGKQAGRLGHGAAAPVLQPPAYMRRQDHHPAGRNCHSSNQQKAADGQMLTTAPRGDGCRR